MPTIMPAEGAVLERVLETAYASWHGLSRHAAARFDAALRGTPWARDHERRFAVVDGSRVLASAQRHILSATLAGRRVRVCGVSAVFVDPDGDDRHAQDLVEWLIDDATAEYDLALLDVTAEQKSQVPAGFEVIPTNEVQLHVAESTRHGAPMTLVRSGEDRDLGAIVAMGEARAAPFPFHLNRDVEYVKYAITKKRLLAGLGPAGARQLQFVIAEEGITAAAYVVMSVSEGRWTIEECGDRHPSGARVGAILQALIAQEPAERRPIIRAWLPPRFVPPQVAIRSERPSTRVVMLKVLDPTMEPPHLSADDVLYWRSDIC